MLLSVCALSKRLIKLPMESTVESIGKAFAEKVGCASFNKFAGAIDGTLINIKVPFKLTKEYNSRKMCTTMILQAVVDNAGKFIDIYTGWPGSVHDSRVLKNSPIFVRKLYPPKDYYLLADSGYFLNDHIGIITPYRDTGNLPVEKIRFNKRHASARSIVERAVWRP